MLAGLVGVSDHDILDGFRQNVAVLRGTCGTLIRGEGVVLVYGRRWMEKGNERSMGGSYGCLLEQHTKNR